MIKKAKRKNNLPMKRIIFITFRQLLRNQNNKTANKYIKGTDPKFRNLLKKILISISMLRKIAWKITQEK